jgi:20S proteasome alpha/beta subunit
MDLCSGVRPFGVSLLIAGWDESHGHALYQVDPSGSYFAWKATAIGKNMINAKTFLEKRYTEMCFVQFTNFHVKILSHLFYYNLLYIYIYIYIYNYNLKLCHRLYWV